MSVVVLRTNPCAALAFITVDACTLPVAPGCKPNIIKRRFGSPTHATTPAGTTETFVSTGNAMYSCCVHGGKS